MATALQQSSPGSTGVWVVSHIFLNHSSLNNDYAVALSDWLAEQGWDDVFLNTDSRRGAGRTPAETNLTQLPDPSEKAARAANARSADAGSK